MAQETYTSTLHKASVLNEDYFLIKRFHRHHNRHIGVHNNEMVAMLVFQTNPAGVELFSYAKTLIVPIN